MHSLKLSETWLRNRAIILECSELLFTNEKFQKTFIDKLYNTSVAIAGNII